MIVVDTFCRFCGILLYLGSRWCECYWMMAREGNVGVVGGVEVCCVWNVDWWTDWVTCCRNCINKTFMDAFASLWVWVRVIRS